jgi:hypothetical protein
MALAQPRSCGPARAARAGGGRAPPLLPLHAAALAAAAAAAATTARPPPAAAAAARAPRRRRRAVAAAAARLPGDADELYAAPGPPPAWVGPVAAARYVGSGRGLEAARTLAAGELLLVSEPLALVEQVRGGWGGGGGLPHARAGGG